VHVDNHTYNTQRNPAEIQTPTHWYLIGRSMTAPPPCVIAQQYFPSTLVSMRFNFLKENFSALKNIII
jgi:hypothetical protein